MLTPTQIRHYRQNGFLVLERFFEDSQIQALRRELAQMIDSAPTIYNNRKNRYGQTVEHASDFSFTLQNPEGVGQVINRISNPLARSEVVLRTYGHPKLLQAVASLCGSDFVPFAESVVIKAAHYGASFDWHQDGSFKTGIQPERGINFGIYLYPSTVENGCLQVIPKSHQWGQVDLKSMVETHGSRLPDSIPVPVNAGDIIVHNRNLVHGSFTNYSADLRITVYFGYHHRQTVAGVFTSDHVYQREKVVALAIQRWAEFEPVIEDKDKLALATEVSTLALNRFHSVVRHLSAEEEAEILRVPPLAI